MCKFQHDAVVTICGGASFLNQPLPTHRGQQANDHPRPLRYHDRPTNEHDPLQTNMTPDKRTRLPTNERNCPQTNMAAQKQTRLPTNEDR
ncbi:hypothetical protein K443DRAFT_110011 [Laccaria amethystina LaAM-08-1]|uniref:Uncharacterized protein n=1 Tax=Laccaria amethystina LaAM-08-1 TaxID=1095629 RepID=A0A0C9X055_9AGAR|nr:hypothetical protein K443DRAFT_110011 [Laccaria amethystina LaAM-08-1]